VISSAAWPLAFGLIAVLTLFFLAVSTRPTVSIGTLLLMIPFQLVDTRYGSSSILFAYVLAIVQFVNGDMKIRMAAPLALIVVAYFMSLAMGDRSIFSYHVLFMFEIFSCLVVFLLAYNFALRVEDAQSVLDILLWINVLSIIYCGLQLAVGPGERFVPFGIEAFRFNPNREPGDPRLVGPFGNPGSTAGYLTLMTLVCAAAFFVGNRRRRFWIGLLAACNMFGLVATGNRAGFLVLLAMAAALLWVFRRELGTGRVLLYTVGGTAVLAIAATVAVTMTDFNRLFLRMETVTETEGGLPATRQGGWPVAIEKVKQHPWFGEGPHFWTGEDAEKIGQGRTEYDEYGELETTYDPYPHSLYLFLLRTVGICGLLAVIGFFVRTWFILNKDLRLRPEPDTRTAIVRMGIVLIPAFLVAQITLEFIRPSTMDYGQFMFALMGLLVGTSDRAMRARAVAVATGAVAAGSPAVRENRAVARQP